MPRLTTIRSRTLALALALAPPALAAETVTLSYAWPAGIDALVTFEGERIRTAGGQSRRVEATGSYRLTSTAVEDGLLLKHSDFQVGRVGGAGAAEQDDMQALMSRIGSALPETVIGAEGTIVRFSGTEAMLAELGVVFAELAETLPPPARARFDQMIAQVMTPEVVERRMVENWNRDVGVWVGAELERDQRYELETTEPAPLLGNTLVPMVVSFEYRGPAQCIEGVGETRCVRLRMHTRVASEKVGEAIAAFVQRLASTGQQVPEIKDITIETTVDLVTDPKTLLPRQVSTSKIIGMQIVQAGQWVESGQTQRQTMRYEYR